MDDSIHRGDDGKATNEEAFWQELTDTFETALDLLREIAEAHGIDPVQASAADVEDLERKLDEAARTHPLSMAASDYAQRVNFWFRHAKKRIDTWGRHAARASELNAVSPQLQADVSSVQEAVEEIATQRRRIHVKLLRALRGQLRTGLHPDLSTEDAAKAAGDANDGVRQSIEMWLRLLEVFPEEEDAILTLLVQLEQLRDGIHRTFPAVHPSALPASPDERARSGSSH